MQVIENGHIYKLDSFEGGTPQELSFINKSSEGTIHDGTTNEEVIRVLLDRLNFFQKNNLSCRENALAITKMEEALHWLNHRTQKRQAQGVEGKMLPHKD